MITLTPCMMHGRRVFISFLFDQTCCPLAGGRAYMISLLVAGRQLFAEFFQNRIASPQNVFSDQAFDFFRRSLAHKFEHLQMVFMADNGKFVVSQYHLSIAKNLISEPIDHVNQPGAFAEIIEQFVKLRIDLRQGF
jgi:hypothetical protein